MKKIFLVSVALLMCGLMIIACAPEKRSKKNKSTITVEVEPASISLDNGESHDFTATVRNKGNVVDGDIFWRVEPENLGVFSSSTSKTTTFTASATESNNGQIIAECAGIKGYANIAVGSAVIIDNIVINGAPAAMEQGEAADLSAVARSGNTPAPSQPVIEWSVSPANLGSLSAATGASVTFTASSVNTGSATVKASYGAVNSSKIIYIGGSAPVSTKRFIFKDNLTDPNIKWAYDMFGDWQWYPSGYVPGRSPNPPATSDFKIEGEAEGIAGASIDPLVGLRLTFTKGTWSGDPYAGMTFGLLSAEDLSEYTKIGFYAKGEIGNEVILIEPKATNQEVITLTSSWTHYERAFPGTGGDTDIVLNVFFKTSAGSTDGSKIYIDYIYLDK